MMPLENPAKLTHGYAIALISAAILSTTAIFIQYLTQTYHMPALVLAFWRDGFVSVTLWLVLGGLFPALLRVDRRHLLYLAGYGLVLALFNAMWTPSVALNGAAVATVLAYCSAAFTALLGWWFLNENLGWAKAVAVGMCLGGCVLVSGALEAEAWQVNAVGIFTGMVSGLCYAVYSLLGRSAAQRGLNPWTTLFYTFSFATLFLFGFNFLPGRILPGAAAHPVDFFWLGRAWGGWGILFLLAAGPTVAGYGLYNMSLALLPSSVANLIATLEPVFTALIAYALFNDRMNGVEIGGSLMILSGVVLLRLTEGRLLRRLRRPRQAAARAAPAD